MSAQVLLRIFLRKGEGLILCWSFCKVLVFPDSLSDAFLAATVIRFSSEMLLGGVLLAGVNPLGAFFAATLGNWIGGLTSYYVGHLGRWDIIERWFRVKEERLVITKRARIEKIWKFNRFFTWLPLIGDLLAIGLGFYRVDIIKKHRIYAIGKVCKICASGFTLLYYLVRES
jgi:membrane protein YqaA with SNARE-associated domain